MKEMKGYFGWAEAQVKAIRERSGANGSTSPETAGMDRAGLSGLGINVSLKLRLGLLSEEEAMRLRELIEGTEMEIENRFQA